MEVKKTTYLVDGCDEPCFEVSNGYAMVRIAKFYHYIGHNTSMVTIYLDGEWNGEEEISDDFDELTAKDAKRIARNLCVYLN